ncbi:RPW8-like protein 1 [Ricinus communis]|uniref:RPW8 domain-containing protein n=1 Tax=Ricinus communis TaxID=3988 RepID=B9S8L6_RICCO|nr:RPW8-like protein 1 [Ricinus communis]EEF40019.1 conserved hypothetical protein [Ricinus communis]|eukprot:XP_015576721.1 RPW8-like protein 1 [Ricinus communis]
MLPEAVLGAALGALLQEIINAKEKATFFRRTLEHLESTLKGVYPIVSDILKIESVPADTCTRFAEQLKKAKALVKMYSDIKKWKLLKKRKVRKLIEEMDASLQRFLTRDFQAAQLLYLAIIDKDVIEMNKKMDRVITLLDRTNGDATTKGYESSSETATEEISAPSSPDTAGQSKPEKAAFELHWEISKEKCLDIHFRRRRV